ncbi:MAG TPA: protein-glutamate O-methyltransferase CheR [candidate division Zixibacteria bacterium]|nr:protein-glutamate O-methyltransferase CheR [candidate division Zixibacteria bacterium]
MPDMVVDQIHLEDREFEQLRTHIRKLCGMEISHEKRYLIECRLRQVLSYGHCRSFAELCDRLENRPDEVLVDRVIDAITTNETLWFRDGYPYRLLYDILLPAAERKRRIKPYRIWSCGCSTGQEPYSIAITVDRWLSHRGDVHFTANDFEIVGTDVSTATLLLALSGRYDKLAVSRGLDRLTLARYFDHIGSYFLIDERVKNMVQYKRLNLIKPVTQMGMFDLIFYRNVSIYLAESVKNEVYRKLYEKLKPGGAMVIGAAEHLLEQKPLLRRVQFEDNVYYLKDSEE